MNCCATCSRSPGWNLRYPGTLELVQMRWDNSYSLQGRKACSRAPTKSTNLVTVCGDRYKTETKKDRFGAWAKPSQIGLLQWSVCHSDKPDAMKSKLSMALAELQKQLSSDAKKHTANLAFWDITLLAATNEKSNDHGRLCNWAHDVWLIHSQSCRAGTSFWNTWLKHQFFFKQYTRLCHCTSCHTAHRGLVEHKQCHPEQLAAKSPFSAYKTRLYCSFVLLLVQHCKPVWLVYLWSVISERFIRFCNFLGSTAIMSTAAREHQEQHCKFEHSTIYPFIYLHNAVVHPCIYPYNGVVRHKHSLHAVLAHTCRKLFAAAALATLSTNLQFPFAEKDSWHLSLTTWRIPSASSMQA